LRWLVAVLTVGAGCFALPAAAQQPHLWRDGGAWVSETSGELPLGSSVRIQAATGSVSVQTGTRGFRYIVRTRVLAPSEQMARRLFAQLRVLPGHSAGFSELRLALNGPQSSLSRLNTEVILELPRDLQVLHIDTQSGNIEVASSSARLQLTTQGGGILVRDAGRSVNARTFGGDIRVLHAGGDVVAYSGGGMIQLGEIGGHAEINGLGGNIEINRIGSGYVNSQGGTITVSRSAGDMVIKTSGGAVRLGEMLGRTFVESAGGNIWLGSARGPVVVNTADGNIELWKLMQSARAQSGSGTITAEFLGGRGVFAESSLRTSSGDVHIYLGGATPVTVEAQIQGGRGQGILTDFQELHVSSESNALVPRAVHAEGFLNGGGPVLNVTATSGQIDIRRAR
jgi:hypothetical protein